MQNFSEYSDHLSVLSRAILCFFPTTFLEIAVYLYVEKFDIHRDLSLLAGFFFFKCKAQSRSESSNSFQISYVQKKFMI